MGEQPSPPGTDARTRLAVTVFALVAGLAIGAYGLHRQFTPPTAFPDFVVFWTAARHAADPLLYNSDHLTALQAWQPGPGPRPFVYPPTFLLLAWPFGLFPYSAAYLAWVSLSSAAFAFAGSFLVKPGWWAGLLPLCLPVMIAAAYGQSTLFLGAAFVGAVVALDKRPALAGALLAAAVCLKPQLVILSPILLIGHWRAAAWAVGSGVALVLASCVFGFHHWLEWPAATAAFADAVRKMPITFANPSVLLPGLPWRVAMAVVGVVFAVWNARGDAARRIVGVIVGSLCCVPYAARLDLALLAPTALVWVLRSGSVSAWLRRFAGAAALMGLVLGPIQVLAFMAVSAFADLPMLGRARGRSAKARGRPKRTPCPEEAS